MASGSGTPLQGSTQPQQSGQAGADRPDSIDWASLLASQQQDAPSGASSLPSAAEQGDPTSSSAAQRRRRREKLREIWSRVSEAHCTLLGLSRYWKMVEPMADEVSLCLETSKMLLMQ